MPLSRAEQLTKQFYEWERIGRGWNCFEDIVDLEPQFYPFFHHFISSTSYVDDGKKNTLFSSFADWFKGEVKNQKDDINFTYNDAEAFVFDNEEKLLGITLTFPQYTKAKSGDTEQFLMMLAYSNLPISFEIIADKDSIQFQLVARESDMSYLRSQIKTFFPEIVTVDSTSFLGFLVLDDCYTVHTDFGLSQEFMRPLLQNSHADKEPFAGLFGMLDTLQNERVVFQVLFKAVKNPWSESIIRSVMDNHGGDFFEDDPNMLKLAREKTSQPLYAVNIRLLVQGENEASATYLIHKLSNIIIGTTASPANSLQMLSESNYSIFKRIDDLIDRTSHRLGMLLNLKELQTFVHLPLNITSNKFQRNISKTKPSPVLTEGYQLVLGKNIHNAQEKVVTVSNEQRFKHTHIIGATGSGKSTLLLNLIAQDISKYNGLCVIDPHGDLIDSILQFIPENRIHDVIVFDPSDSEYPIGFNILHAHNDIERETLSSDLISVFKRLSTSWGDQMNSVFANAILAFLESSQGGTLIDLRRFLIEKPYRDKFLSTVNDPHIVYYWTKEFPLLKSNSIAPILTRLDTFLRPKLVRNMVGQKKGLDFEKILNTNKILLVKLSQGLIGIENSYLLGTFIVSKIHQAALSRQSTTKENRNNFFLYIDEFQHFITPSMSGILSGARKYHLGLILAHQNLQQLSQTDTELSNTLLSNAGTRICFRVGETDAKRLEEGFSYFTKEDLQNLKTGEAIVKIEKPEFDFNLTTLFDNNESTKSYSDEIISHSRQEYASQKIDVEQSLHSSIEVQPQVLSVKEIKNPQTETTVTEKTEIPIQPIVEAEKEVQTFVKRKEETRHRYLQLLIKKMAESKGFKAAIEELTSDGKGRVDVALTRENKKIAVEISVTTSSEWEMHNAIKCLESGYEVVLVCSEETNTRNKISELIHDSLKERMIVVDPESLFLYLDQQIAKEAYKEERVKGYRVKVNYNATSSEDATSKLNTVLKAVTKSKDKSKK